MTDKQIARLDFVHRQIYELLCHLAGRAIPWDMEVIGEMSDVAEEHICGKLGAMTPKEFAPYDEV